MCIPIHLQQRLFMQELTLIWVISTMVLLLLKPILVKPFISPFLLMLDIHYQV